MFQPLLREGFHGEKCPIDKEFVADHKKTGYLCM